PGEFRDLINYDIYSSPGGDFLKSRRGSDFIAGDPWFSASVLRAALCWDTGTDEYVIAVMDNQVFSKNLTTPGNPTLIADFSAAAFTFSPPVQPCMFIHGDRLFLLSSSGNYVIQYFSGTFKIRPLGMTFPYLSSY